MCETVEQWISDRTEDLKSEQTFCGIKIIIFFFFVYEFKCLIVQFAKINLLLNEFSETKRDDFQLFVNILKTFRLTYKILKTKNYNERVEGENTISIFFCSMIKEFRIETNVFPASYLFCEWRRLHSRNYSFFIVESSINIVLVVTVLASCPKFSFFFQRIELIRSR